MRQYETEKRTADLLKTQRHCRGHSEKDAHVCSSMAKTPQGTALTVLALFKQQGPKTNKQKKCKAYLVCFLVCLCFNPLSH